MAPDEIMTEIDGVRVRRDEEKRYRAMHKAVLGPAPQQPAEKKTVRRRKAPDTDDE